LVIVKMYGLKALPPEWYKQLFSDDRRRLELDRLWGRDTATKRGSRTYARQLWLSFGGTRGVGGALPAFMRDKETIRGVFRAVRETLQTMPVKSIPNTWSSPLWSFFHTWQEPEPEPQPVAPMPERKKSDLKLLRAARKSAKVHGVRLHRPKKKAPIDDGPSDLEEFVMKLGPSPEELRTSERKAERRADRMMARATGGFAFKEEEEFIQNLRWIS
jgi:hypothetical protein